MTGNVQLYLTEDSLQERPRMGAQIVGFGRGVKGALTAAGAE